MIYFWVAGLVEIFVVSNFEIWFLKQMLSSDPRLIYLKVPMGY